MPSFLDWQLVQRGPWCLDVGYHLASSLTVADRRAHEGDLVRITLRNALPVGTTIHWHGVRVPNAMDGVPGISQPPVRPGETFVSRAIPLAAAAG